MSKNVKNGVPLAKTLAHSVWFVYVLQDAVCIAVRGRRPFSRPAPIFTQDSSTPRKSSKYLGATT